MVAPRRTWEWPRPVPLWVWAALLALPLRLPLLLRPEPGRDEAAYFYWSRHLELAYAPLMQLFAKFGFLLPIPELLALRLPSLLGGVVLLALFDRWMVVNDVSPRMRWIGLLGVALCPWQIFVGSLLHPDGVFAAAVLLFVLAASSGRLVASALAVVLAVWAKPTGLLLLPAFLRLLSGFEGWRTWRGGLALLALLAGIAPVAAAWDVGMVAEVSRFGVRDDTGILGRGIGFALLTVLSGGLLLSLGAVRGLQHLVRTGSTTDRRETVAMVIAVAFLVVFGLAAVLRGQFKANWILPAFLVLWPFARIPQPSFVRWGLASAAFCSLLLVVAVRWPEQVAWATGGATEPVLESGILAPDFLEREQRDWASIEPFARAVEAGVLQADGGQTIPPDHIVADDYGLAMQLAYRWRDSGTTVAVPAHGLFRERSGASERQRATHRRTLLLTKGSSEAPVTLRLSHPKTGEVLEVALLADETPPSSETTKLAVAPSPGLHAPFDSLLAKYLTAKGVRYSQWNATRADVDRLSGYIDRLEAQRPSEWSRNDALAYWINLYNAATLELVLANYPVQSIKNIGAIFRSPWKIKVVTVEGKEYTLDNIEHDTIRKKFEEPRIHFALNCASVGCPPLAPTAYRGDSLDVQLDRACRKALNDPGWVEITPEAIQLTKLFDWYRDDFKRNPGSVREFVARYRPADRDVLLDPERKIEYMDYDWKLNEAR